MISRQPKLVEIRESYTCALAFVFVRLYQGILKDSVFGIIENRDVRVVEWMQFPIIRVRHETKEKHRHVRYVKQPHIIM